MLKSESQTDFLLLKVICMYIITENCLYGSMLISYNLLSCAHVVGTLFVKSVLWCYVDLLCSKNLQEKGNSGSNCSLHWELPGKTWEEILLAYILLHTIVNSVMWKLYFLVTKVIIFLLRTFHPLYKNVACQLVTPCALFCSILYMCKWSLCIYKCKSHWFFFLDYGILFWRKTSHSTVFEVFVELLAGSQTSIQGNTV